MLLTRWRNVSILKNAFLPSLSQSNSHYASIHSTPAAFYRRNNKSKSESARFVVRQKRADAKKALKGIIFGDLSSKASFENEMPKWEYDPEPWSGTDKRKQTKPSARHRRKSHNKKVKRKFKGERFSDEEDEPETIFQATFGNRWYTWSFNQSYSQSSTFGHESKEHQRWKSFIDEERDARSERESYDESCSIGSSHDRIILGLPSSGPININDVKNAFRISALKWHPDKHQGPSQEKAEEKFKVCVNAYKSLCNALSGS